MNSLFDLIRDIRAKSAAMKKLHEDLPRIIGVENTRIIKENFRLQGYDTGSGLKRWAKRKQVTNTAYDYNRTASYRTPKLGKKSKYKNPYKGSVVSSKRPLLTQTGNLRDSINYKVEGKSVVSGVFPNIKKPSALQEAHTYAKKMNEGGTGKWGHATTHTDARQFMPRPNDPPNPKMIKAYKKKYQFELDRLMGDWKK